MHGMHYLLVFVAVCAAGNNVFGTEESTVALCCGETPPQWAHKYSRLKAPYTHFALHICDFYREQISEELKSYLLNPSDAEKLLSSCYINAAPFHFNEIARKCNEKKLSTEAQLAMLDDAFGVYKEVLQKQWRSLPIVFSDTVALTKELGIDAKGIHFLSAHIYALRAFSCFCCKHIGVDPLDNATTFLRGKVLATLYDKMFFDGAFSS